MGKVQICKIGHVRDGTDVTDLIVSWVQFLKTRKTGERTQIRNPVAIYTQPRQVYQTGQLTDVRNLIEPQIERIQIRGILDACNVHNPQRHRIKTIKRKHITGCGISDPKSRLHHDFEVGICENHRLVFIGITWAGRFIGFVTVTGAVG